MCGVAEYLAIAGAPTISAAWVPAIWAGVRIATGGALDEEALIYAQRLAVLGALGLIPTSMVGLLGATVGLC